MFEHMIDIIILVTGLPSETPLPPLALRIEELGPPLTDLCVLLSARVRMVTLRVLL